jgi:flavin reductase (DIM6/NTAB) family NADH-FMN oxidoreductase RutF
MTIHKKHDFPVSEIRRFLEPGPVVLVSSAGKDERNIMTMGWHMVMDFTPSLVGCLISRDNYSYGFAQFAPLIPAENALR